MWCSTPGIVYSCGQDSSGQPGTIPSEDLRCPPLLCPQTKGSSAPRPVLLPGRGCHPRPPPPASQSIVCGARARISRRQLLGKGLGGGPAGRGAGRGPLLCACQGATGSCRPSPLQSRLHLPSLLLAFRDPIVFESVVIAHHGRVWRKKALTSWSEREKKGRGTGGRTKTDVTSCDHRMRSCFKNQDSPLGNIR